MFDTKHRKELPSNTKSACLNPRCFEICRRRKLMSWRGGANSTEGENEEKGGHECLCDVHEHEVMRREWERWRRQNWSGVQSTRVRVHIHTHARGHADLRYPATGSAGGPDTRGTPPPHAPTSHLPPSARDGVCVCLCRARPLRGSGGRNNKQIRLESGTEKQAYRSSSPTSCKHTL